MTKKDSSLLNSNYVPMIGCFVAGFVVSRLMNHQDIVTGYVKEGQPPNDPQYTFTVGLILGVCGFAVVLGFIFRRMVKKGQNQAPRD